MVLSLSSQALPLGPSEAAIVFLKDGDVELVFGDTQTGVMPENIRWALAVMYALRDSDLSQKIHHHFDRECTRLRMESQQVPPAPTSNLVHFHSFKKGEVI